MGMLKSDHLNSLYSIRKKKKTKNTLVKGMHLFCRSPGGSASSESSNTTRSTPLLSLLQENGVLHPCGYFRLLGRSSWTRIVPPPLPPPPPPLFVPCWAEKRLPETEK
uniref:Uncharacterized protein n=1 Tax=Calidris pygmaea TaxID=425635 RepID=A0A8C3KDK0_9CHAR